MGRYSKYYGHLHDECYNDIDNAIDSLKQLKKIFINYVNTLNIGDYETLTSESPDKNDRYFELKNYIYNLSDTIDEIDGFLDDALSEAKDMEDEIDDLKSDISEMEDMISLDDYQIESPSTHSESELLWLVLEVYKNKDRLTEADQQILRVLSQKTL